MKPGVFIALLLFTFGCSSVHNAESSIDLEKEKLIGTWEYVAYSGGIAGLPESPAVEDIQIIFGNRGSYQEFLNGTLTRKTVFDVIYEESALGHGLKLFLVIGNDQTEKVRFEFQEEKLVVFGDHVDAMSKIYKRIK